MRLSRDQKSSCIKALMARTPSDRSLVIDREMLLTEVH
jgi:hypothetical protein